MRKTPTYDWAWFDSHTPFKKILEETCELEIEKEVIPYRVFGNIWSKRIHYNIKLNYPMLKDNFEEVKRRILNTRVCKYNKEIFDYVNKMESSKKDACNLVTDGCMSYSSASFSWDWCDNYSNEKIQEHLSSSINTIKTTVVDYAKNAILG